MLIDLIFKKDCSRRKGERISFGRKVSINRGREPESSRANEVNNSWEGVKLINFWEKIGRFSIRNRFAPEKYENKGKMSRTWTNHLKSQYSLSDLEKVINEQLQKIIELEKLKVER